MNYDLWWSLHRNLNRTSHSGYSKEVSFTQGIAQGHTPSWPAGQLSSLPRGLCLCSYFRGATLPSAASGILFKLEPYCMAPMTNPSVTPQLSQSQTWILIKSYKAPHDLPPWPLCLIPFHFPPLTRSAPATLVLAAAQTHQAHFWQPLPPYKRGFPWPSIELVQPPLSPSLFFFTSLIAIWQRTFPFLYDLSPSKEASWASLVA